MATYGIHRKAKGSSEENEDWWDLCIDDATGAKSIRHSWNYTNPYKGKVTSKGSKSWTVEEFLASGEPEAVKDKLRILFKEQGDDA